MGSLYTQNMLGSVQLQVFVGGDLCFFACTDCLCFSLKFLAWIPYNVYLIGATPFTLSSKNWKLVYLLSNLKGKTMPLKVGNIFLRVVNKKRSTTLLEKINIHLRAHIFNVLLILSRIPPFQSKPSWYMAWKYQKNSKYRIVTNFHCYENLLSGIWYISKSVVACFSTLFHRAEYILYGNS